MKNTSTIVLSVLLLIFLFIGLTSSKSIESPEQHTNMSSRLVYPATPKSIFTDYYTTESAVVRDIKLYSSRGYIVKSNTSCPGSYGDRYWILVMEKY